jgi:nucleotide-binding universal stress UspA family protein
VFKKVLFPTDFSAYAEITLEYVVGLKDIGAEQIVLVHTLQEAEEYPVTMARKERMLARLKDTEAWLKGQGLDAISRVELGTAYREILRVAEEENVDLITIGCHGKGLLDEVVIGSVSDRVAREASMPVLLVKHKILQDETGVRLVKRSAEAFQKILYPTDCSPCAQSALDYIKGLSLPFCGQVIMANIIDPKTAAADKLESAKREMEAKLDTMARAMEGTCIRVSTVVRIGNPLEELLKIGKEEKVSLIVMGSTGKGFFTEMLIGSISENMIRKARCPVLIIHNTVCALQVD